MGNFATNIAWTMLSAATMNMNSRLRDERPRAIRISLFNLNMFEFVWMPVAPSTLSHRKKRKRGKLLSINCDQMGVNLPLSIQYQCIFRIDQMSFLEMLKIQIETNDEWAFKMIFFSPFIWYLCSFRSTVCHKLLYIGCYMWFNWCWTFMPTNVPIQFLYRAR